MATQVPSTPRLESLAAQTVNRQTYLSNLLQQSLDAPSSGSNSEFSQRLRALREHAADRVRSLSIPSTRDEEWRFTDLSQLLKIQFQHIDPAASTTDVEQIQSLVLPEVKGRCLTFIDGIYAPQLSSMAAMPDGVHIGSIRNAEFGKTVHSQVDKYLGQQSGIDEAFTALNTASFADAVVIWVPQGQIIDGPIQILFVSTSEERPTASYPRCLVIAEPNSALTLIEDYVAIGSGVYFTNPVTEMWIDDNAQVTHCRIQRDSKSSFHIGKTAIAQQRNSRYTCHTIDLGAKLSRHSLEVFQHGEQTETTLNGLTMIASDQLADTHSLMAYTKPYGTSQQLHKCIVDDRAHAVFNGKVNVPQSAQMTDAGQLNRNLLLSSKARIDTKPQLEIVADNVKCTHGATVSQLDADEVFYLQSRGIDTSSAQSLLIYAFAAEVIDRIPVESLKQMLRQSVSTYHQLPVS